MMENIRIFHAQTDNLNDFDKVACYAKESGATHVMVGDLPRSHWMWDADRSDPYSNWSMGHAQLFKLVCPPLLEPYLPQDHIHACMELVKQRCGILRKYGLKPALFSNEPFWLPEQVYRDHPSWRGARCDHPRRSRKPYYSPNIDDPEVLDLYRHAMRELCRQTGINFFRVMSNDSGGGIAFSSGTYVGPNGPRKSRSIPMSDRICGFLDALSEGAREGGVDAVIHFNSDIPFKAKDEVIGSIWPLLKENQIVNGRNCYGDECVASATDLGSPREPVRKLPKVLQFGRFVMESSCVNRAVTLLSAPRSDFDEAFVLLRLSKGRIIHNTADLYALLYDTAKELAGEKYADPLLESWVAEDESYSHLSHTGLNLLMYGCQHQRWINRPFVLFPEELPEDQKKYYRDYQFQAQGEKEADDLMDLQGIEGVRGFTAVFMLTQTLQKAIGSMSRAIGLLQPLLEAQDCPLDKHKLNLLIRRLRIQNCFYENIINASRFQELKDRIVPDRPPLLSLRWPTRNDHRIEEFQDITRDEIDNMYELIDCIGDDLSELITCTEPENEDIFVYSTKLKDQLRLKAEVMLDHMDDGKRVFETNNV